MFLEGKDYLNIWDLAHRWAGVDPDSSDPTQLPEEIVYLIHKIVEGYWTYGLKLRRANGKRVPREPIWVIIWNINIWQKSLERCLFDDEINKKVLRGFFVKRTELIKLCEKEDIDTPEFWSKKKSPPASLKANVNNRPLDENTDRLICQAIARTYWDIDPQIHPAHMAKARAIKLYANGQQYKDENTIKGWIADIDPLKDQRKIGRPKEIHYLIDLETGVLAGNQTK